MALERGTLAGEYRIEGILGRGGMGVVYSARHLELDRHVALKLLAGDLGEDPEFVERFRREGRLQASLEHPHVITVYDAGESDQGLFIAMRLVSGSTLATLMRERALDTTRAVRLLRQVADALDAAHAAGLVHRDVKPQNVLVGEADDAYLGDFGLTRGIDSGAMTATGRLVGTVAYLAPEVIRGGEATPASDRYAFAAMVFECLTGTPVFPRSSDAAMLFAHTSEPPPRISRRRAGLPESLDATFTAALAKEPDERPASARALIDTVERLLREGGAESLGPPPPQETPAAPDDTTLAPLTAPGAPPPGVRRLVPWIAGAIAGAALALALAAVLDDDPGGRPAGDPVPAVLRGATALGSDLGEPGRTVDCRGRTPGLASASCTVTQTDLPGRTLVVPRDGVIRRWGVRSARGELSLVVLRQRDDAAKQIARSNNEFVGNGGVHLFAANIAVERGDTVGLVIAPGSGIGARAGVPGAATRRWIPRLQGAEESRAFDPGSGFDHELLLRVEYVPGGEQALPDQVTGAAAATLPAGRVRARRTARPIKGPALEVALVEVDDRFVLDQFIEGRRTARIDVPTDLRPAHGRLVDFDVYPEPTPPEQLGVYIEWVNDESARILDHYFAAFPREFVFYD